MEVTVLILADVTHSISTSIQRKPLLRNFSSRSTISPGSILFSPSAKCAASINGQYLLYNQSRQGSSNASRQRPPVIAPPFPPVATLPKSISALMNATKLKNVGQRFQWNPSPYPTETLRYRGFFATDPIITYISYTYTP